MKKGSAAEVAVRDYLRANGFPYAERLATEGSKDRGDISGLPGVVVEVKACKTMDLGGWMKELDVEMLNAGVSTGLIIHKRRLTTDVGEWFATMPVRIAVSLL